jgi:hypothetical protein
MCVTCKGRRRDDATIPTAKPSGLVVDEHGRLTVRDAVSRRALILPPGRRDIVSLAPIPYLRNIKAVGAGFVHLHLPAAEFVTLIDCVDLEEVVVPYAHDVHVSNAPRLRRLRTVVEPQHVPVVRDLPERTVRLFRDREARISDAERRGNRWHGTPHLTWPHLVCKAAEAVTIAAIDVARSTTIQTAATLLVLAARPAGGVPDWSPPGAGDAPWIAAMEAWGRS